MTNLEHRTTQFRGETVRASAGTIDARLHAIPGQIVRLPSKRLSATDTSV
jgi:hypothetical protein